MVTQLKIYNGPVLALELINGFSENDFELIQKLVTEKREKGFNKANFLIKLDGLKITESNIKALLAQIGKLIKNFKEFGRIAIVGDSAMLEKFVKVDNYFLQILNNGSEEKYFDKEDLNEALRFIEQK